MATLAQCTKCYRTNIYGIKCRGLCYSCRHKERYSTDENFRKYCVKQSTKHNLNHPQPHKPRPEYHSKYYKIYGILRKYGINHQDYNRMLTEQHGLCAICRNPPAKHRLCIDHDHTTGRVRGLLCYRCNIVVGYYEIIHEFGDKIDIYLSQNKNLTLLA